MNIKTNSYSFSSVKFWQAYLITMRPYLLFVSGAAGLVGLAFIEDPPLIVFMLAFIPLFLSYGLGQAITDCFQTDTDAKSSPYRPLIRGTVTRNQVLGVSLAGAAAGLVIMGYLNPKIIALWILAVIGLLTYTPFKRTWWGGPPWNAWIVALLPIMARLADREFRVGDIVRLGDRSSLAFFLAVLTIFFGYANFVMIGYFKDISADRETGYQTLPVVFGWHWAAVFSDLVALLAVILAGYVLFSINSPNIWGILLFGMAAVITLYAQIRIHQIRDEDEAHGPIGNVVRAFLLICLAIVASLKADWLIFIVIYYLLFELILKLRPDKSQV